MKITDISDEVDSYKKLKLEFLSSDAASCWEEPKHFEGDNFPLRKYDSAGIYHNMMVSEFMKTEEFQEILAKNKTLKNDTKEAIRLIGSGMGNFCKKHKTICDLLNKWGVAGNNPTDIVLPIFNHATAQKLLDEGIEKNGISKRGAKYGNQLVFLKSKLLEEKIKEIRALEITILSDEEIKELEKERLMSMASVGRYSLAFWDNYQWDRYNSVRSIKKIDWDKAGVMDTIGALGGPETAAVGSVASMVCDLIF